MKDTPISTPIPKVRLIMASSEPLPIVGCVKAPIRIDQLAVSQQLLISCGKFDNYGVPFVPKNAYFIK